MKKWLLTLLIIALAYIVFSGEFFIEARGAIFSSMQDRLAHKNELSYIREKNQQLEIEVLNLREGHLLVDNKKGINAKVFSVYPFADRSKIIVNAGKEQGVEIGSAVTSGNILVGRVIETARRTSVVQTVFDSRFQIPARIGEAEIDALYTGGMRPKLRIIDTNDPPQYGEIVVSASPELPYGLGIGKILYVSEGVMKEAVIEPFLEIKKIRNVFIIAI